MTLALELPDSALDALASKVAECLAASNATDPEPWVNAQAISQHLGCQRRRVYELARQDRIPHVRDGERLLFRKSAVDAALESGRMELNG